MKVVKVKKHAPNVGQRLTKEFIFDLTEQDIAEKGTMAAELAGEIAKQYVELDEIKKERLAAIRTKESERDNHLAVIRARKENRTVEALMIKNFEANLVQYFFQGKLLEERPMTLEERQMEMALKPKKGKQKTGAEKIYDKKQNDLSASSDAKTVSQLAGKDLADTIRSETSRKTKRSPVDGVWNHGAG